MRNFKGKEMVDLLLFEKENQTDSVALKLLTYFPDQANDIILGLSLHNNNRLACRLMKKNKRILDKLITKENLSQINETQTKGAFKYFCKLYEEGKIRLITLYRLFEDYPNFLKQFVNRSYRFLNKNSASLISKHKYNEECYMQYDFIQEQKRSSGCHSYLSLPKGYKISFISDSDLSYSLDALEKAGKSGTNSGVFGVDSEWRPEVSFLDEYNNIQVDENKEGGDGDCEVSVQKNDIIQIGNAEYCFILDVKSFEKNEELRKKFLEAFSGKKFIGFSFKSF